MACIETAYEYLKMFQDYQLRKGFSHDDALQTTGILVDDSGNLVPYVLSGSHTSYQESLRALKAGADTDEVPFIFMRIPPCPECAANIQARTHLREGITHFEDIFQAKPPACR